MALASYSDLKTAVENWLARTDQSARTPEFIALAEADINRRLAIREMETRATASTTANSAYLVLPISSANFLAIRRLVMTSTDPNRELEYRTPQQIYRDYPGDTLGKPFVYSIEGTEIHLRPIPDAAYTIEAFCLNRLSAISDAATPVLFTNNPDLYLYGALSHAIPFINEPDEVARFQQFRGLYEQALAGIDKADRRARWAQPLQMRTDYPTP